MCWKRAQQRSWFCTFRDTEGLALLGRQDPAPPPPHQGHIVAVETEAQREVGVGGGQMQGDPAADLGPHLGGGALRSVGERGWWAVRT